MKITFEGETLNDIAEQVIVLLLEMGHPIVTSQEPEKPSETVSAPKVPSVPEEQETAPDEVPVGDRENYDDTPPPPEDPKPAKTSKTSKPKTPKPVEETKTEDPEKARKEAISRLMVLYNKNSGATAKVKALLKDFGVAKFSEVSDAQVPQLLDRTAELEKELA